MKAQEYDNSTGNVLHCITVGGNWFTAAQRINELDLALYVVAVSEMCGNYTMVMVCLPVHLLEQLQADKRIF